MNNSYSSIQTLLIVWGMNFTANIVKKSLKVHLSITTSSAVEDHVGANKLQNSYSAKIVVRSFSQTSHHIFHQTQQTHHVTVTHKNISLWKSSSTLTSPFAAFGTFPSTFERTSSAGRFVKSNLSVQGRSLRKSARHCFIPSCITTQYKRQYIIIGH